MLSRFFLPGSKHLLISWLQSPSRVILEPKKRKSVTASSFSPFYLPRSAAGLGVTECSSACMGLFEGGHHYLHYLHHSLASGQVTGRKHSPAHQQKIELRFTEHGPAHKNTTEFPPQSGSPIRKLP